MLPLSIRKYIRKYSSLTYYFIPRYGTLKLSFIVFIHSFEQMRVYVGNAVCHTVP